jgi:hypothetical protein
MIRVPFILSLIAISLAAKAQDATFERELAYSALHIVDWMQTRSIAAQPKQWEEKNLILGSHPSQARVNRYMGLTLAGHWAVTYTLPEAYRPAWQYGTIAIEAYVIHKNYNLGITARF